MLSLKETELQTFLTDASKYTSAKKEELRMARREIVDVFDVVKR